MNTLSFQTQLDSNMVRLPDNNNFMGKHVIVTIIEVSGKTSKDKKKWRFLGAINLAQNLDRMNIRDLAYE